MTDTDDDNEDFATLFDAPSVDIEAEMLLWTQVQHHVTPLNARKRVREDAPTRMTMRSLMDDYVYEPEPRESLDAVQPVQEDIERRINKGRIPIELTIDLHDKHREDAHRHLYEMLHNAHRAGKRTALVITGKGRASEGVLKQSLPRWLASSSFADIVSSYAPAANQHGGSGAFYVRLRKK